MRFFIPLAVLLLSALGASVARADDADYPAKGLSLGGRAAWYQADNGLGNNQWYGGAQARLHLTKTWAVEGSGDYRQRLDNGSRISVVPVQASLEVYPLPTLFHIAPFALAGVGWYYTRVNAPNGFNSTQHRFGPHVGLGAEFFLNHRWSVDATYRHVWISDINEPNTSTNQRLRDSGHQMTAGINFHF
jgi:opacity protein-like surface antigen